MLYPTCDMRVQEPGIPDCPNDSHSFYEPSRNAVEHRHNGQLDMATH
jgi:hypothetical protein